MQFSLLALCAAILLGLIPHAGNADMLHMGPEQRIECVIEEVQPDGYVIRTGYGTLIIPKPAVQRVTRATEQENAALLAAWAPDAAATPLPAGVLAEVTDRNFVTAVLKARKPVLVDFYATWCPPCRVQDPIIVKLAREFADTVRFAKVDVDRNLLADQLFRVESLPTLMLFRDGRPVKAFVGLHGADDLREHLRSPSP